MNNSEKAWCYISNERINLLKEVIKLDLSSVLEKSWRRGDALNTAVSGRNVGNRGVKYFNYIVEKNFNLLKNNINSIIETDKIGNPFVLNLNHNKFSLVCSDSVICGIFPLQKLLEYMNVDKLDNNLNVIEIGCGFGVQTKMFNDFYGFKSYTNVDLKCMLDLQKNFLDYFNINNVIYNDPENIETLAVKDQYDLLISDFAYTELSPEFKLFYFNEIIKKCKMGIILGRMDITNESAGHNFINKKIYNLFKDTFRIVKYEKNSIYGKGGIIYFCK